MTPTSKEQELISRVLKLKLTLAFIIGIFVMFVFAKIDYNPMVRYYTSAGRIEQPTRVWDGIVTVTTASAQSVDISSAGFTQINSAVITPANNTTTTTSMPIASIKSYSTTGIVFNTLVSNTAGLGILVGLIAPGSVVGMQVHVHVDGW